VTIASRSLASAALAAAVLASSLALVTALINPELSLRAEGPALVRSILVPAFAVATPTLWVIALLASTLGGQGTARRPPIEGLPWVATLVFLALAAAATIEWLNLLSYRHSIPVGHVRALAGAAVGSTLAALLLVAVGVDVLAFPRRSRGIAPALVVLAASSAVVVPLALRPSWEAPPTLVSLATEPVSPRRRVILVGIDGLGPDDLREGIERGNLPALAWMLKRGSHGPLATLRPTEGPPIWTSIVTGRLPRDHGVKSFTRYRLEGSETDLDLLPKGAGVTFLEQAGLVRRTPLLSTARRSRAIWNALDAFGIPAGIVRIWGTAPPERIQGFVLSPHFDLVARDPEKAAGALTPPTLLAEVVARAVEPGDLDRTLVSEFVDQSVEAPRDDVSWRRDLVERALAPDTTYYRAGNVLRSAYDPPFFAIYFYGLDVVGHGFRRFSRPDEYGDVSPLQQRRYGRVFDRYAALLSSWVGEYAEGMRPGEVLLVVSGYGLRAVPAWRRLLDLTPATPERSATHEDAPDGLVIAYGDGIRAGAVISGASVLDVTPTVLYLMGLPVGRDMPGRVLTEIVDDSFARSSPVSFIPSYESLAVKPATTDTESVPPLLPDEEP
jgi:predicted AlkP superfamily phosphohydrolase/phosphomutase